MTVFAVSSSVRDDGSANLMYLDYATIGKNLPVQPAKLQS